MRIIRSLVIVPSLCHRSIFGDVSNIQPINSFPIKNTIVQILFHNAIECLCGGEFSCSMFDTVTCSFLVDYNWRQRWPANTSLAVTNSGTPCTWHVSVSIGMSPVQVLTAEPFETRSRCSDGRLHGSSDWKLHLCRRDGAWNRRARPDRFQSKSKSVCRLCWHGRVCWFLVEAVRLVQCCGDQTRPVSGAWFIQCHLRAINSGWI